MAVVVEIQKRHAATHRLGQQLFAISAVVVNESDAGLLRNVGEFRHRDFGLRTSRRHRRVQPGYLRAWRWRLALQKKDRSANQHGANDKPNERPADGFADDGVVGVNQFVIVMIRFGRWLIAHGELL